jgi:hypothetical protein
LWVFVDAEIRTTPERSCYSLTADSMRRSGTSHINATNT